MEKEIYKLSTMDIVLNVRDKKIVIQSLLSSYVVFRLLRFIILIRIYIFKTTRSF